MRKPKKIKLPKQPKESASVETWKNYKKKVADVDKRNAAKLKPYKAHLAEQKKKKSLIAGVKKHKAKIGAKTYC